MMKRYSLYILSGILLAGLILWIALKVSIPLATNSDFQVLYYTNVGLLQGVDVYDQQGKIQVISQIKGVSLDMDFIPQFAYPPWFALSTFYLGLFSIQVAAVLWFEINLLMIFLSIWYLTDNWPGLQRLTAFPAAVLFFPVLGMLVIGQYDFPVLLGTSMLIHSIRHRHAVLTALAMALLTFKPHIGGVILLAGLIHILLNRDDFGKRVLVYLTVTGVFLFAVGFLADSVWPINYVDSLLNYSGLKHITSCSECASASVWISRFYDGSPGLSQASIIAVVLLISSVTVLFLARPFIWKSSSLLITAAVFVTLIASPYLYNYDYVLLIVPFTLLFYEIKNNIVKVILVLCYLAPYFAIGIYGRDGNISLIVITMILAALFYLKVRAIDVPAHAA
jgi:hypothetical protein